MSNFPRGSHYVDPLNVRPLILLTLNQINMRFWMWACFALWTVTAHGQDTGTDTSDIPALNKRAERDLQRLSSQAQHLTTSLQQQSIRLLDRL